MTDSQHLDATFAALADPTRRAILARLASGQASVNELVQPFNMSQPAISKHLKVLERAGLISRGVDGQRRPRRIEPKPFADATNGLKNTAAVVGGQLPASRRTARPAQDRKLEDQGKETARQETIKEVFRDEYWEPETDHPRRP